MAVTTTTTAVSPGQEIVLVVRSGPHRFTLTACQLRDTVASYLARDARPPTTSVDPLEPWHVISEEWLYGDVTGWVDSADVRQLTRYRHQATQWMRSHLGLSLAELDDQLAIPDLDQHTRS
jgi:hypothetical protein